MHSQFDAHSHLGASYNITTCFWEMGGNHWDCRWNWEEHKKNSTLTVTQTNSGSNLGLATILFA